MRLGARRRDGDVVLGLSRLVCRLGGQRRRLCHVQAGLGSRLLGFEQRVVQPEQRVTGLDGLSFVCQHGLDLAGQFRGDIHGGRFDRAGCGQGAVVAAGQGAHPVIAADDQH